MADRPRKTLPAEPVIQTEAQLALALQEQSWIEGEQAAVNAWVKEQMAPILKAAEERLRYGPKGKPQTAFVDRLKALSDAVQAFAKQCKAKLLGSDDPKVKSKAFTFGEIKYQEQRETVGVAAANKEADQKLLDDLTVAVATKLKAKLAELTFRGVGKSAAEFLDVSVSLNKTRAKDALENGRVTAEQLAAAGLCKYRPEEKVLVTINAYDVVSASQEAAA